MFTYLVQRILIMIPTLLVVSILIFIIIQLPPGDFLSNQLEELRSQGDTAAIEKIAFLRAQYGLDRSAWVDRLGPESTAGVPRPHRGLPRSFPREP